MNLLKHMEAVFIATLALAVSAVYLTDSAAAGDMPAQPVLSASTATMPVVVVCAKRMSAEEKRQSLIEERQLAAMRGSANRS